MGVNRLRKGLTAFQLTMLALGTVIGGSFFLASSIAINWAGPSVIIGFIIGGLLVYFILTALSEMTVDHPHPGSFRTYAAQAYGPYLGFIVGWVYWTGLVLGMSSEATAVALLIRSQLPDLPLSWLTVGIITIITILNLLGASKLAKLESFLVVFKLAALTAFISIALILILGLLPAKDPVGLGALSTAPFLPNGIGGLAGSMLIILFCYAGFEIIGLAAAETNNPQVTVPRAIRMTILSLVTLYILVIVLLLPLLSTTRLSTEISPFVAALNNMGLNLAGELVNLVLIAAILSAMLATTFGLGRMLRSLADSGQAPSFLIDRGEVPLKGILFSGIAMLLGVSMASILPNRVYLFLVSSGGFSLLLVYLIIMVSHMKFRSLYGCPPHGHCQLPGFPYTSWASIISMVVVIITMPLIPGQGSGLLAGLLLVAFYSLAYLAQRLALFRTAPAAKRTKDNPGYSEQKRDKQE
jgi:L-asparagine transporter-like permease